MTKELIKLLAGLGAAVYWRLAPQNAQYPFCILAKVSEVPNQDELSATAETEYSYQLDIYAKTIAEAEDLKEEAMPLLNRPGEVFELGRYYVAYFRVDSVEDNTELEIVGAESTVSRITIEFRIKATKEEEDGETEKDF